jgi:hypothetical protein
MMQERLEEYIGINVVIDIAHVDRSIRQSLAVLYVCRDQLNLVLFWIEE